jgi:hypothetical protein
MKLWLAQSLLPSSFNSSTSKPILRFSSVRIVAASATPEVETLLENSTNAFAASSSFVAAEPSPHCIVCS